MKKTLLLLASIGFFISSKAQTTVFQESFADISNFPGSLILLDEGFDSMTNMTNNGWQLLNRSNPIGQITNGWFQGDAARFPSQSGAATDSYAAANFNSTSGTGLISSWMISPTVTVKNGDVITFWSRTIDYAINDIQYPDRLEFRMSTAGDASTNPTDSEDLGSFTTNLLTINPDLLINVYPEGWYKYTIVVNGLPELTECQFAFRYSVPNGGPAGANSNYIGVDSFTIKRNSWKILNVSNPLGSNAGWFQGGGFTAHSGADTEFISANFNSTTSNGTISSWLITPVISLQNNDIVSFWSRTASAATVYPDRLEVRLSTLGENSVYPDNESDVGSFTTLLTVINPDLTSTGYPQSWTNFTNILNNLPGLTDCKIAFRYYVTDGGSNGINSNFIGLDTFTISRPALANHTQESLSQPRIYPNPISDLINIDFATLYTENASIRIIDLMGKEVASYSNLALHNNLISLTTPENMAKGIYTIVISTQEQQFIQKIIKNK